jgi:LacI family transcriptional regulator
MAGPKRQTQKVVSLRQIADEVGVSVSLVSKVLNGRMGNTGAQAAKVAAIHDKALSLGYRKNLLAQALRTGRQNVLAVCVHRLGELGSGIVEEMVAGIAAEAAAQHQRLMLHYYETADEFRAFAPELQRNAADGVIMGGLGHPELIKDLKSMHSRGLPVVTIHDEKLSPMFANVGMDQVEVARYATRHLIEQGCRRIAHLKVVEHRYEGYRRALDEAKIRFDPALVVESGLYSYPAGTEAVNRLLASGAVFDGIVGCSDHHSAAALNVLTGRGLKVPEQVKLIGIDNAPFCQFAAVPLSSVSQEYEIRGRHAVRVLMTFLQDKSASVTQVPPVVCARASSAR